MPLTPQVILQGITSARWMSAFEVGRSSSAVVNVERSCDKRSIAEAQSDM